jgi:DUF4097 and DUF4098 domain-containing protein YvlB
MKRISNRLFGFFFLAFLVGVGGLVWQFHQGGHFHFDVQSIDEQRTITQQVNNIELKTETADVVFSAAQESSISVRLVGEVSAALKPTLQTEVTPDGILRITVGEPKQGGFFFSPNTRLELQVTIPAAAYQDVQLATVTGDIRTGSLQAKRLTIQTGTGNVKLNGFEGDQLAVSTGTGDMDLVGIRGDVNIDSDTGNVQDLVLAELTGNVDITTDTGDVQIKVEKKPAAVRLDLKSDTGEVDAEWPGLSYSERTDHRLDGSNGSDGPRILVRSATGDIRIQ